MTAILDKTIRPARALAGGTDSLITPTARPIISTPADPRDPVAVANAFLQKHARTLDGTGPGLELAPYEMKSDKVGMRHVRYHQLYERVRVYGSEVIVHLTRDNAVSGLNARVVNGMSVDPAPALTAAEGEARARDAYATQYGSENPRTLRAVLEVFDTNFFSRNKKENFSLVWRVHLAHPTSQ